MEPSRIPDHEPYSSEQLEEIARRFALGDAWWDWSCSAHCAVILPELANQRTLLRFVMDQQAVIFYAIPESGKVISQFLGASLLGSRLDPGLPGLKAKSLNLKSAQIVLLRARELELLGGKLDTPGNQELLDALARVEEGRQSAVDVLRHLGGLLIGIDS